MSTPENFTMTIDRDANGIMDKAEHVVFLVGAWQDFGYENPPTPESRAIPPLGERSALAITSGHSAVKKIDELVIQLHAVRARLVAEMRRDEAIRMSRPLP